VPPRRGFDDYHAITLAAIHKVMAFLLEHTPVAAGMHVVIAGRADPPLPVPRLRAPVKRARAVLPLDGGGRFFCRRKWF
jgi:hypothetical protein